MESSGATTNAHFLFKAPLYEIHHVASPRRRQPWRGLRRDHGASDDRSRGRQHDPAHLQSTNGSRVNNEEVQLKILRAGDLISIGRSTLVYGAREHINDRLDVSSTPSDPGHADKLAGVAESLSSEEPPTLPKRLSPGQAAQLSEVIEYLHIVDLQSRLAEYTNKIGKPTS